MLIHIYIAGVILRYHHCAGLTTPHTLLTGPARTDPVLKVFAVNDDSARNS